MINDMVDAGESYCFIIIDNRPEEYESVCDLDGFPCVPSVLNPILTHNLTRHNGL